MFTTKLIVKYTSVTKGNTVKILFNADSGEASTRTGFMATYSTEVTFETSVNNSRLSFLSNRTAV